MLAFSNYYVWTLLQTDFKANGNVLDVRNNISEYPFEEREKFCGYSSEQKLMEFRKACKNMQDKDVTLLLLKKEIESALQSLKEVQVEMAKLRDEKEDMSVSKKLNEKSLRCLTSQVLTLQSAMNEFEKKIQVKTEAASHKFQALEQNVREAGTCFHLTKEVTLSAKSLFLSNIFPFFNYLFYI